MDFCRTAQLELDGFNRHCHAFVDFPLILTTVFCVWYWYPDPGSHFRCLVESIRIANACTFSFSRCFVSPQSNQKAKIEFSFLVKECGNYNFAKNYFSSFELKQVFKRNPHSKVISIISVPFLANKPTRQKIFNKIMH